MIKSDLLAVLLFVIVTVAVKSNGQRTKDKMYDTIKGVSACFRRMNGTHQIGCSSSRSGSTGVVHFVETVLDLSFMLENATAGPYVPVMPTKLFTPDTVAMLKKSDKIAGLVLFNDNETLDYYTHEDSCPNRGSNIDKTCTVKWNKFGTNLLNQDYPFPIFYVNNDEEVAKIKDCFGKFNNFSYETQNVRSLCSLELSAFMYATTDTPTCIRRSNSNTNLNPVKFCDPLGDENIWASLFPVANITPDEPAIEYQYIVVTARLDTTSLFHEMMPGAANPVTGLVAFLSTAHLLKKMLPKYPPNGKNKNVLFVLLNGETYDYIGSQRLLYDMEHDAFPIKKTEGDIIPLIKPENISLLIELGELSFGNDVVAHVLDDKTEVTKFFTKLNKYKGQLIFNTSTGLIPPASLQTFMKNRTDFPGLVLTDHKRSYVSRFYNSIYDNASNIAYNYYNATSDAEIPSNTVQGHIAKITTMIANSLYEEITNETYRGDEKISVRLIDELFHCYLENASCLVHKIFQKKKAREEPYSFYVGVSVSQNSITSLIGLTLAWLTGDIVNTTNRNCTNDPKNYVFRYFNMSKSLDDLNMTVCIRSTLNFTEAVSPAFIIDDYNWKSGKYSSWSESTWRDIGMRIFLKPSAAHENMTIAIGSMTLIFSFIIVYFVKSRSHILFVEPETSSPTSC